MAASGQTDRTPASREGYINGGKTGAARVPPSPPGRQTEANPSDRRFHRSDYVCRQGTSGLDTYIEVVQAGKGSRGPTDHVGARRGDSGEVRTIQV